MNLSEAPLEDWRFRVDTAVEVGPREYWPALDEAPWPDLDSVESIQILAAVMRSDPTSVLESLKDFVADADADGVLDYDLERASEGPWMALLAEHARAYVDADSQGIEHVRSNQIAQAIVADGPNDPAADSARLHLLQVANDTGSAEHDPKDAAG